MSFLRGNFRKKAIDVDFTGIGGNLANWIQTSNINPDFRYGGFVVASFASVSVSAFAQMSAGDFITQTYGATMASNQMSVGYKVIPVAVQDVSGGVTWHLSATGAMAGDDSVVILAANSASGAWSGAGHFIAFGFIVSTPFQVH